MRALLVRRRAAAWVLAAGCAVGVSALCWPGPAAAQEPDVAAWWSSANLGDPAPAPPAPPDVNSGDLLVQGSNTVPAPGAPIGSGPGSAQAVAGLAFDLQPTDLVGPLTLAIDGNAPPQVSVVACRTTQRFTEVENGAWSRVPAYDANSCVPGALKDGRVEFADIGKLVQDAQLAVVLLPGPVDRLVFAKPGENALDVTHAGGVGSSAPSFGSGTAGGGGSGGGLGSGAVTSGAGPAAAGSSSANLPPAATSPDAGLPPVVAGSSSPTSSTTSPATSPVAARHRLSTSARRWIALLVIALEVVGFAALTRMPDPAALPLATAAPAAGGRLRPPDRWNAGRGRTAVVGGVGRFRRERQAPAPPV
jgi:hypothetical protein